MTENNGNYRLDSNDGTIQDGWMTGMIRRTHPLNAPRSEKLFAMLTAYVDDSGTHADSQNCLFGGYWGTADQWDNFEQAWKLVLDSEGVDEFHAKVIWRIALNDTAWNDKRVVRFVSRLLDVIESTRIVPFWCGVIKADWKSLPPYTKMIFSMFNNEHDQFHLPQLLAMQWIVSRSSDYCTSDQRMNFVFDLDRHQMMTAISEVFGRVKLAKDEFGNALYGQIGAITYDDSRIATPLQAADLLVYEAHKWIKRYEGDTSFPLRDEYQRAISGMRKPTDFALYDGKSLLILENDRIKRFVSSL